MARLIERRAVAERSGSEHAERTGEHRSFIGKDIAEHVLRYHDIELLRIVDQLHSGIVNEHIDKFDIGILLGDTMRDLTPHARGFEHVRFVDRVNTTAAFACGLERMANDAFDLVFGVHERVVSLLAGSAVHASASNIVCALTFAEIKTARELANDHAIDTIDNGRFECRGIRQRIEDHDRTKVRIKP